MENKIRDSLATQLYLIDPNLRLIDTEYYLSNHEGTRSFVDILAQDDEKNYVVIEIKRTNEAARQAIHEIIKYVDALKRNKKCTNEEIIVLVAAVEWKELIGPFSSFVRMSNFSVKGIKLIVDENYSVVSCQKVQPLNKSESRYISPIQTCLFFTDKDSLEKGILSHQSSFNEIPIKDYIALILKSNHNMILCKYSIYIAIQRQSKEDYELLLSRDEALLEEIFAVLNLHNRSEEEELRLFESNLIGGFGRTRSEYDDIEIGNPTKLTNMLEQGNWVVEKLIRYGALKENTLLSDSQIIDEMKGMRGSDNVVYHNEISSRHIERIDEIKECISKTLTYNPAWRSQICNILDYYKRLSKKEEFDLKIEIYAPSNIILDFYTNYSELIPNNGFPRFVIEVTFPNNNDLKKLYLGLIKWNGICPNIDLIVKKYYNNDPWLVSQCLMWRDLENNNYILEDIGCEYISLLNVYEAGTQKDVYLMSKYEFDRVNNSSLNYLYVDEIYGQFPSVIAQIIALFDNVMIMSYP